MQHINFYFSYVFVNEPSLKIQKTQKIQKSAQLTPLSPTEEKGDTFKNFYNFFANRRMNVVRVSMSYYPLYVRPGVPHLAPKCSNTLFSSL